MTTLGGGRSRSRTSGTLLPILAAAVAVAGALALACGGGPETVPRDEELARKGLPADLPRYAARLRALHLPIGGGGLGWLPGDLQTLEVAGLPADAVGGLPRGLQTLVVAGYAALPSLDGLPPGLRELDLSLAEVESLAGLPSGIRKLKVGRVSGFEPRALGGTEFLSLDGTAVRNLFGSPPALRSLELAGPEVEGLEGGGDALQAIVLHRTLLQSLADLPPDLESLELTGNPLLDPVRLDGLPGSLTELVITRQRVTGPLSLRYLRLLYFRGVRFDGGAGLPPLPTSLTELEIESDRLDGLGGLPPQLRHLGLVGDRRHDLSALSSTLRSLYLEGGVTSSVSTLAAPVELLTLRVYGTAAPALLEAIPENVTELDLTGVQVAPSATWSPGLTSLRYRDVPLAALPALPATLEVLDLTGAAGLRSLGDLGGLENLREVRLRGTEVSSLSGLPASVRALDITATPIRSLKGHSWPPGLAELTFGQYQLESLEGLPESVEVLRIEPALAPAEPAPGSAAGGNG